MLDLKFTDAPLAAPAAPDADARVVHVGPVAGEGATIADCWIDALTGLARGLAAEKAGPPHLRGLTVRVAEPEALRETDRWLLELLHREALGGNFCETVVLADDSAPLTVEAHAVVPAPPAGPVYGDMDAAALNYAYSARSQVPTHMAFLEAWRREGYEFQREQRTAEIAFGDGPGRRVDLYMPDLPAGSKPPPLHVFVHGGYWQSLDKADHGQFFAAMLGAGFAVALPNYDLLPTPGVTLDDLAEHCRQAVDALWTARDAHGYDMGRMTVSGHSAGGQLGAMLAATDWPARDPAMPADLVKGAVLISGLYDLEPVRLTGVNHAIGMDAEMAARNSPVHLAPAHPLPLVVAVGGEESDEFRRQSRIFAEAWQAHGAPAELMELDGLNHFTALEAIGDPATRLGARSLRLLSDA